MRCASLICKIVFSLSFMSSLFAAGNKKCGVFDSLLKCGPYKSQGDNQKKSDLLPILTPKDKDAEFLMLAIISYNVAYFTQKLNELCSRYRFSGDFLTEISRLELHQAKIFYDVFFTFNVMFIPKNIKEEILSADVVPENKLYLYCS